MPYGPEESREEIEKVLRIEANLKVGTLVFTSHTLFTFAGLHRGREDLHLVLEELHPNRAGPFIRKLSHTVDCRAYFILLQLSHEQMIFGSTRS